MRPGQHHLSFVVSCGGAALRPRGQLPPLFALLPCSQSLGRSGLKPLTGTSTRPAVLPVSPSSASLPRQTQPAVPTVNSPPPQRQRRPTSQYNKSIAQENFRLELEILDFARLDEKEISDLSTRRIA